MIQAKELRIGNKIRYSIHEVTVKEVGIYLYGDNVKTEEVIDGALSEYDGISITEEKLLECGFKKDYAESGQIYAHYKKGDWKINFENGVYVFWRGDFSVIVKFIHQLQNLYYALTGQELPKES